MNFKQRIEELESIIQAAAAGEITLDRAETEAANFLMAQMQVSSELAKADLDSRTRKAGVKAVRAAIYLETVQGAEGKRPTEATLEHILNTSSIVASEQSALDSAEVRKAELERLYDVFNQAHVYFRQVSRGVQG